MKIKTHNSLLLLSFFLTLLFAVSVTLAEDPKDSAEANSKDEGPSENYVVSDPVVDEKEDEVQEVAPEAEPEEEPTDIYLNFENASLASIVNHLAERKKINIVPHKDLVNAKVSLHTRKAISLSQAWDILLTLMELNNFTIVEVNGLYRIVSTSENSREPLKSFSSATGTEPEDLSDNDEVVRYVYFLKNMKVDIAYNILNSILTRDAVQINRDLDVLIIKEKSFSIKSAMKIIKELDQGGLKQSIKIVRLKYADPNSVARLFREEILNPAKQDGNVRFVAPNKKDASYFSPNIKIIPDPPRKALTMMGQEKDIDRLIQFMRKYIDVPMKNAHSRIHVREVNHVDPEQLSRILNNMTQDPPGVSQESGTKLFEDVIITVETTQEGGSHGGGNRLIISCGDDDWVRLQRMIDRLDKPQAQIALEVMIVNLDSSLTRNLHSQLRQKNITRFKDSDVKYEVANMSDFATSGANASKSMTNMTTRIAGDQGTSAFTIGGNKNDPMSDPWIAIKTFLSDTNNSVISQPFIIVKSGESCTVSSGEEKRVEGPMRGNSGVVEWETLNAKSMVDLLPRINLDGMIDIEVGANIDEFEEAGAAEEYPTTRRSVKTRATMRTGEVLVLGGLTKSKQSWNQKRMPLLSSIPVLGSLFRGKEKTSRKGSLYIFIRPSVVKPQFGGQIDDYTQCKLDYAKYQVFKIDPYSKSKDPIDLWFFKPRKHGVAETLAAAKQKRFNWMDDYSEGKYNPRVVNMRTNPTYQNSAVMRNVRKKFHERQRWLAGSKVASKNIQDPAGVLPKLKKRVSPQAATAKQA